MKIFVLFFVFLVLGPVLFFTNAKVSNFNDIKLNNDSRIYVGENETCISYGIEAQCLEGFKCVLTSTHPQPTGICVGVDENVTDYSELDLNYNYETINVVVPD